MSENDISEGVRHFIFDKIDSVEQLEVLLLLREHQPASMSAEKISSELRSSVSSVTSRLTYLEQLSLVIKDPNNPKTYLFKPSNPKDVDTVNALAEIYKIKRQKVLELIFSSLKKARHFANAFMVTSKKGDPNG